jgi:undecaprenyl-diphosphatase
METTQAILQWLDQWISAHPTLSGLLVFLVAFSESLLIIGIIVPGAALMIGIGILIANGNLPLGSTMLWAIAGAVSGDGFSFWLGYHFRERLPRWPLMRRYQKLFDHGQRFFNRHGGKSVVFGRFVGPVRAIIPTIAGLMAMPPWQFLLVNVVSAILWAPVYLLPGLILGATIELAAEVTLRLIVLLLILLTLFLLTRWFIRFLYRRLAPRTGMLIGSLLRWSQRHPLSGRLVSALIDPQRPETPVLTGLAVTLLLAAVLFFSILTQISSSLAPGGVNQSIYLFMQSLRTPAMDTIMTAITMLGDMVVLTGFATLGILWLWWKGQRPAAIHWLAAIAFGGILVRVLKVTLDVPRPALEGITPGSFSFPSAHTSMSLLVYGFAAVILARQVSARWHYPVYLLTGVLVMLIALSRLYLGVHWFSDVLGGLMLGLVWISLLGIAWRRHSFRPVPAMQLSLVMILTLLASASVHIGTSLDSQIARYSLRYPVTHMKLVDWQAEGWKKLPALRNDLALVHRQPLTVQWAGKLDDIRRRLEGHGWRLARNVSLLNCVQWLHPKPDIARMPLMPHIHAGRYERLAMVLPGDKGQQVVLRLWPANILLDGDIPLWTGTVSRQMLTRRLYLFSYPSTGTDFDTPLRALVPVARTRWSRTVLRPAAATTDGIRWNGTVVLLR